MSNPVTPYKIGDILRKAGFERSKQRTTRIRGWYHNTQGYSIEKPTPGDTEVYITYQNDSQGIGHAVSIPEQVAGIIAALEAAGLVAVAGANPGTVIVQIGG